MRFQVCHTDACDYRQVLRGRCRAVRLYSRTSRTLPCTGCQMFYTFRWQCLGRVRLRKCDLERPKAARFFLSCLTASIAQDQTAGMVLVRLIAVICRIILKSAALAWLDHPFGHLQEPQASGCLDPVDHSLAGQHSSPYPIFRLLA